MQRLSGLDAGFVYMETPNNHMHVAATCVFDPSEIPGGWSFERLREMIASRLHMVPPFRRRLLSVPLELHHPVWVEDPDFDIEYHVRRAALPSPGGDRELTEFAADIISRPLHRDHPLWEMHVVEGLENGMVAIVTKTHHAAVDGVSGAELAVILLDLSPTPTMGEPPEKEWKGERLPSEIELLGGAMIELSTQPAKAVKAFRRTAEVALSLRRRNREPDVAPPPSLFAAPRSSINTSITPHRRFAYTQVSLDDVKAIKNTLGGTVNDVVLAICAGALRRYFEGLKEHVEGSLVAMVPLSVRTEEEKGAMGNKLSQLLVSLHTDIDDPVERLHAISEGTGHAKEQEGAVGVATMLEDWVEFAAPGLAARAARLYARTKMADRHRPLFNVTISNVPGPNFPLYSAGARMVAMYPMGPIFDGGGLNMTVMSYMGQMYFGLVSCRETVPELWGIAAGLNDALDELRKAAAAASKPASATRKQAGTTGTKASSAQ